MAAMSRQAAGLSTERQSLWLGSFKSSACRLRAWLSPNASHAHHLTMTDPDDRSTCNRLRRGGTASVRLSPTRITNEIRYEPCNFFIARAPALPHSWRASGDIPDWLRVPARTLGGRGPLLAVHLIRRPMRRCRVEARKWQSPLTTGICRGRRLPTGNGCRFSCSREKSTSCFVKPFAQRNICGSSLLLVRNKLSRINESMHRS